jgi:hypothetical protein
MMSTFPAPVILDDAELLKVAATPRTRLFPLLDRANGLTPLILICCIFPAFQLLQEPDFNEQSSIWGLRNLATAKSTTWFGFLEPGLADPGLPLIFQPPLASWVNAPFIRTFGPTHVLSNALVSLVSAAISIGLTARLAYRIGGVSTALIASLLLCSHPQLLEWSVIPGNAALGCCFLLISLDQFHRYFEQGPAVSSMPLVWSGLAWGLLLLTAGSVALIPLPLFACYEWIRQPIAQTHESGRDTNRVLPVYKACLMVLGIGMIAGGWWPLLMWIKYGNVFWPRWLTNIPEMCLSSGSIEWQCTALPQLQQTWRQWLAGQVIIVGWVLAGLGRSVDDWRRDSNDVSVRINRLVTVWWTVAFCGRFVAEFVGTKLPVNTALWNLALLPPTILLATRGIETLIERKLSRRAEFLLIVLTVGTTLTPFAVSPAVSIASALIVAAILALGSLLKRIIGRTGKGWSETRWRQILQTMICASLIGCLTTGILQRFLKSTDETGLVEFRTRLTTLPDVQRVTLLSTRDPIPITVVYFLKCRWPDADLVSSEGWDPGLTTAMNKETAFPRSRFLIIEWTRDIRMPADTSQLWQVSAVGDPLRVLGRRLSLVLIGPNT